MNDGPHKSLHMGRKWKKVAEYGDDANHDIADVCDRLSIAMLTELASLPFQKLNLAFVINPDSLFAHEPADQIEVLESSRRHCPGSSIGTTYLDGCISALADGLSGEAVIRAGIAAAIEDCYRSSERNMIEHYKRKVGSGRAERLSGRLRQARNQCNFESEIRQILSTGAFKMRKPSARRTDLDAGPSILGGQS